MSRIVYLDQNAWVALARASWDKTEFPREYAALTKVVERVRSNEIIVPLSFANWTDRANRIVENHGETSGPVEWRPSAARSLSQAPEPMSRAAHRPMKLFRSLAMAVARARAPVARRLRASGFHPFSRGLS